MRWGSRRSALGVKEKCVRGQGEVPQLNNTLCLDLESFLFRVKKTKKIVFKNFFKTKHFSTFTCICSEKLVFKLGNPFNEDVPAHIFSDPVLDGGSAS